MLQVPAHRHSPRLGTPCVPLHGRYVCMGHMKTKLRKQYKSTYYHFLYALEPAPPYAVVNVSHPFRLRPLPPNATRRVHAMLGKAFAPRAGTYRRERAHGRPFEEEKIQFVSGMLAAEDGETLRLSYGVNDCVAATRRLAVSEAVALLERRRVVQPAWSFFV